MIDRYKKQNLQDREQRSLKYLYKLRWSEGYRCPRCNDERNWQIYDFKYKCKRCGYQTTVTSGTIFQDTHVPLSTWFEAILYVVSQRKITNAVELQKEFDLGSYRTAWMMLNKIREAMSYSMPDKLRGNVLVDTFPITANKSIYAFIAVELNNGVIGRISINVPEKGVSLNTLYDFIKKNIVQNSTVGLMRSEEYYALSRRDYDLRFIPQANDGKGLLEGVDEVVLDMKKRGLLGSIKGLSRKHIDSYLVECCFKYNGRNQNGKQLFDMIIQGALQLQPKPYKEIVLN